MRDCATAQISNVAALVYKEGRLSALFDLGIDVTGIKTGHRVIEVACGTGAPAIAVSDLISLK